MVKDLAIVGLLLAIVVSVPIPAANTDSIEAACADVQLWLSGVAPIGFLEMVCTINESGVPVAFEFGSDDENVLFEQDSDTEEYEPAIQELELPEETRQQLLLLLALWSQE